MKHINLFALTSALLLASCGGSTSILSPASSTPLDKDIAWVSPKGIPAAAFFDQGANENWQSFGDATQVAPFFANDNVDFVVFDATNGLTNIAKNNRNYKFASWISEGTFYLVSAKHSSVAEYEKGQTIDAFVEKGNASYAFRHLASNKWNWGELTADDVTYETGVAAVKTKIEANANAYDYYVVAQPVLFTLSQTVTFSLVLSLQTEWAALYEGEKIPAAGLFVNMTSYANKKEACDAFIASTQARILTAKENPAEAVKAFQEYGESKIADRFGFAAGPFNKLQQNGANGFGLIDGKNMDKAARMKIANDFAGHVGLSTYSESLFID